jgi:HEAT repeat protein
MHIEQSEIDRLSKWNFKKLITLLSDPTLDSDTLAYAAEVAGNNIASNIIRSPLEKLLNHKDSIVREGAIFGLSKHLTPQLKKRIQFMSLHDENNDVRSAALDILED